MPFYFVSLASLMSNEIRVEQCVNIDACPRVLRSNEYSLPLERFAVEISDNARRRID